MLARMTKLYNLNPMLRADIWVRMTRLAPMGEGSPVKNRSCPSCWNRVSLKKMVPMYSRANVEAKMSALLGNLLMVWKYMSVAGARPKLMKSERVSRYCPNVVSASNFLASEPSQASKTILVRMQAIAQAVFWKYASVVAVMPMHMLVADNIFGSKYLTDFFGRDRVVFTNVIFP